MSEIPESNAQNFWQKRCSNIYALRVFEYMLKYGVVINAQEICKENDNDTNHAKYAEIIDDVVSAEEWKKENGTLIKPFAYTGDYYIVNPQHPNAIHYTNITADLIIHLVKPIMEENKKSLPYMTNADLLIKSAVQIAKNPDLQTAVHAPKSIEMAFNKILLQSYENNGYETTKLLLTDAISFIDALHTRNHDARLKARKIKYKKIPKDKAGFISDLGLDQTDEE